MDTVASVLNQRKVLTGMSEGALREIVDCRGPLGLVQSNDTFKDAQMVNLSILFLAIGVPLLIVSSMAISMYNNYIESEAKVEDKEQFSNLNATQIFFLVVSIACILAGAVFLGMNLMRRSKVELLLLGKL